jgi:predicted transglutaminase-like cysteine proteinase
MLRAKAVFDRTHRTLCTGLQGASLLVCGLLISTVSRAWSPERVIEAAMHRGDMAVQGARALSKAMAAVQSRDELTQVRGVNDFYNQHLLYRDDVEIWGQVDYWASPLESLQRGMGDCEDFAIAKYFTLTSLGVPHHKLRLVYVRANLGAGASTLGASGQPHMVLAYYASRDADPLVLDNLIGELRPARLRPDLTPVFSFNAEGLWEGVGPVSVRGAAATVRLSRWREVLVKAAQDGLFP